MIARLLGLFALLLPYAPRANASHTVFDFAFDHAEIDGQPLGLKDGVPDFTDDFNGATLGTYTVFFGTASETGGSLHLTNPGLDDAIDDATAVYRSGADAVNGGGDVCYTVTWPPMTIPVNGFLTAGFGNGGTNEATLIGLARPDPTVATSLGIPSGVSLLFINSIPPSITIRGSALMESDVTGTVYMRVCLNDASDSALASISLDGGTTFLTPFPPVPTFQLGSQTPSMFAGNLVVTTTTTTSTTLPEDTGFVPPDAATRRCEDGVAKALSRYVASVIKCHVKSADSEAKGVPLDDEGCETNASTGKGAKEKYEAAIAKLGQKCSGCMIMNSAALRASALSFLESSNGQVYCAGTSPF